MLGHLPYAPFFDPGPAYNNFGPDAILSTGAIGGTIDPGVPVYQPTDTGCGSSAMSSVSIATSSRRTWRITT